MNENQRKLLYDAAVAVLAALGGFGIVDGATTDHILQVVAGGLTALAAIVPLVARRKVGVSGVDVDYAGYEDGEDEPGEDEPVKEPIDGEGQIVDEEYDPQCAE